MGEANGPNQSCRCGVYSCLYICICPSISNAPPYSRSPFQPPFQVWYATSDEEGCLPGCGMVRSLYERCCNLYIFMLKLYPLRYRVYILRLLALLQMLCYVVLCLRMQTPSDSHHFFLRSINNRITHVFWMYYCVSREFFNVLDVIVLSSLTNIWINVRGINTDTVRIGWRDGMKTKRGRESWMRGRENGEHCES